MKKVLILICAIFLVSLLSAEPVNLTITPPRAVYNYFYPSYLDPANPEQQPQLFWLSAVNTGNQTISDYEIHLHLQWREYDLVSNAIIKPRSGSLFEYLEPGLPYQFSSREIIIYEQSVNFYAVQGLELEAILDENEDFQDLVLRLGYFPDGDYVFTVQLFDTMGTTLSTPASFTFTIITPSAITLISPGNPLVMKPLNISDPLPYFVWFSNLMDQQIRIYELTGSESSEEDIELQSDLVYSEDLGNSVVFSYPASGYPLQYGKVYAWQIVAAITTPLSSREDVKSNMYFFRLSPESVTTQDDILLQNFLQQLNFEGSEQLLELLEQGYGFDRIIWQEQEQPAEFLNVILQQILSGETSVKSFTIE
ncbi:MAG: hypothetical protein JW784_02200 [Candidatus Cloacimonetes bacterium]|nr:hypothetical protein [Candidatus Cloacimonadota bacterium]